MIEKVQVTYLHIYMYKQSRWAQLDHYVCREQSNNIIMIRICLRASEFIFDSTLQNLKACCNKSFF